MRTALPFALLLTVAFTLSACDSVADLSYDDRTSAHDADRHQQPGADQPQPVPSATCPCFSKQSLAATPEVFSTIDAAPGTPYLFFDVFNYYGLDPRRTEVRATWQTNEGLFEEVAAVYITPGSDALHLICFSQEVVRDPYEGDLTYRYDTQSPTIEEAEACRQDIIAFVDEREPCQGAACGIQYSKEQMDPDYPPYNDEGYRTPDPVLDEMRREVERVGRMLQLPA